MGGGGSRRLRSSARSRFESWSARAIISKPALSRRVCISGSTVSMPRSACTRMPSSSSQVCSVSSLTPRRAERRSKVDFRVRFRPSIHLLRKSGMAVLYLFGGQLAAAGLDIDAAPDADGAGNAGSFQLGFEGLGAGAGGGLPGVLAGRVERDDVDVAQQAMEQNAQA